MASPSRTRRPARRPTSRSCTPRRRPEGSCMGMRPASSHRPTTAAASGGCCWIRCQRERAGRRGCHRKRCGAAIAIAHRAAAPARAISIRTARRPPLQFLSGCLKSAAKAPRRISIWRFLREHLLLYAIAHTPGGVSAPIGAAAALHLAPPVVDPSPRPSIFAILGLGRDPKPRVNQRVVTRHLRRQDDRKHFPGDRYSNGEV